MFTAFILRRFHVNVQILPTFVQSPEYTRSTTLVHQSDFVLAWNCTNSAKSDTIHRYIEGDRLGILKSNILQF
jgi:hypothetical protein